MVESDAAGEVDLEALRNLLDDRVKLIALTHVPTNGGLVQPAARVGELARAAGIPFLLDACQSAGQIHLDVDALGCDMLSATGRKYLRGPRGTGFLYVRNALLAQMDPPSLDLHAATWVAQGKFEVRSDAKKFETWESAAATRLGLGVAIEYALALGLKRIEAPGSASGRTAAGAVGPSKGCYRARSGPGSLRHCDLYLQRSFTRRSDAAAEGKRNRGANRSNGPPPASTWSSAASMSW